jgi:hypothetical protein
VFDSFLGCWGTSNDGEYLPEAAIVSAQASVVRPVRLTGVLLALVTPVLLTLACAAAWGPDLGVPLGLVVYVLYRLVVVRRVVCRDHRLGVSLARRGKFEDGIAAFRRSEAFWESHPNLDRFRALVLGSGTSHSFYVVALCNQAYCLSRLARGDEAHELVERVLSKHPDMLPARELRDIMAAGRGTTVAASSRTDGVSN